ncbi:MAG: hypothetical protein LBV12_06485 [Puniceicoccales bacterium]|jgi:hypothetical protein|nr:hypothetical protein [Puniceicoccales bacterium]
MNLPEAHIQLLAWRDLLMVPYREAVDAFYPGKAGRWKRVEIEQMPAVQAAINLILQELVQTGSVTTPTQSRWLLVSGSEFSGCDSRAGLKEPDRGGFGRRVISGLHP